MTESIKKSTVTNNFEKNYIRVGVDYFKIIEKPDRYGIIHTELKKWNRREIELDHGKELVKKIAKYDDFIIEPDNNGIENSMGKMYNLYNKFPHEPKAGKWKWTKILLEHIFQNQYELALIYLKVLYQYPKQALPILVLVSQERQTGKTTFLNWLNVIFGANMVQIEPDVIGSNFNGEYATANIIGIDETIIDKQIAVEKIKSLATKKFISVNNKNVQQFTIPFFSKIVIASNNEDRFMKIDMVEIRFWLRKLSKPTIENHNIENDMVKEIPAFLHYLTTLQNPDFSKSRMVFTADQLDNEFLLNVKKESMSGLYHELNELFSDFFSQNDGAKDIKIIPNDIKSKWFKSNNQISIKYIRNVLKNEYKFKVLELQKYTPFNDGDNRTGRPYIVNREQFTEVEYNENGEGSEIPF